MESADEGHLQFQVFQAENHVPLKLIRAIVMGIQRMRNVSIPGDDVTSSRTIFEQLPLTRGSVDPATLPDEDNVKPEIQVSNTTESKVFLPTKNPLVGSVTLVAFISRSTRPKKKWSSSFPQAGVKRNESYSI